MAQKIKVIKEVRAVTELAVEASRRTSGGRRTRCSRRGSRRADAEAIKEKIEKVGGKVVLE